MTLPPPPSDNFSAQQNVNALVGLRALHSAMEPNPFPKEGQAPGTLVQTIHLDVWVLDGPQRGQFFSDSRNSSALGRQFADRCGDGVIYYGRVTAKQAGQGTSLYLSEPYPTDQPMIDWHRQSLASQGFGQPASAQPNGQAAYPQQTPAPSPYQPQAAQPAYPAPSYPPAQPQSYGQPQPVPGQPAPFPPNQPPAQPAYATPPQPAAQPGAGQAPQAPPPQGPLPPATPADDRPPY